jgi:hypothetical protein
LRSSQREFAGSNINGACNVRPRIGSQCIEQVAMAGKAHAAQIEAGFGDTAGEHSYFGMGLLDTRSIRRLQSNVVTQIPA